MTTNPRNTPICKVCDRHRYVIRAKGDYSVAERCKACFAHCDACDGAGFEYLKDDRGYSYVRPCSECGPVDRRMDLFNKAHLPSKYAKTSSFDMFVCEGPDEQKLQKVKRTLYEYARGFGPGDRGFVLWGGVGTGKTHLMASVIRFLTIEKGVPARFVEFTHLLSQIRERFDQGGGEAAVLGPIIDVEVLAIDEMGKGRANDWQTSVIDEIISKRYNRGLTTLATTNYPITAPRLKDDGDSKSMMRAMTQETLRDRVGERIYSRLNEMADFIHIDAADYRNRTS